MLLGTLLGATVGALNAASVTQFGIFKGQDFVQTSAGVPTTPEEYGVFAFALGTTASSVLVGSVQAPGQLVPLFFQPNERDLRLFEAEALYGTAGELNAAYPAGNYQFSFIGLTGMETATIALAADAYPGTPAMGNYAEGQNLDPAQPFTVRWDPPAQMTASDSVRIEVEQGERRLSSPLPWELGALPGTTTSFLIPAGTFVPGQDTPRLNLTFIKIAGQSTTALPGAVGVSGFYRSTEIELKLKSGSTGGDTTPPTLVSVAPTNNAQGVALTAPLVLTFSEPMQPTQSVVLGPTVSANNLAYAWSADARTLTCTYAGGYPPNTLVIWALNASGTSDFKDLAGNPLGTSGGLFTTGTGSDPCGGGPGEPPNILVVVKMLSYQQTSSAAPTLSTDGEDPPAGFGAFLRPEAGANVTGASVAVPGGAVRTLVGMAGLFNYSESFAQQAPLDAAYPAGAYTAQMQTPAGTVTLPVNLGATYPTTPRATNYDALQAAHAGADILVSWDAFAGAGPGDLIDFEVTDAQGRTVFSAPDPCRPVLLTNYDTSVTIPRNTLQSNATYRARLEFVDVTDLRTNAAPALGAVAALTKSTHFTIKTGTGGIPPAPVIQSYAITPDGYFQVLVSAQAGALLTLSASTDYLAWTDVANTLAVQGAPAVLRDPTPASARVRVYRVSAR